MDTLSLEPPRLVAARPPRGRNRSALQRWRERRETVFAGVPDEAYEKPMMASATPWGRFVLVNDPAGVKRVLVDNVANYPKTEMENRGFTALFGEGLLGTEGELWRRHRRIMAPAFQPSAVASYGPAMAETAAAFAQRWDARPRGAPMNAAAEMTLLTLQIISKTMFSTDRAEVTDLITHTMEHALDSANFNLLDLVPILSAHRMREREARMKAAFRPLDGMIEGLIAERAGKRGGTDLLARLVDATDSESGAALSVKEARDEVITIFVAGHETTAVAMSWIWYLLALHPREEAMLHAELDRVLAGRTPTQEDLDQLVYARRVVEEAMRLYPPAPGLSTRVALKDDEVAGMRVRAGATLGIMPWVLQRHHLLWDAPERFDPDRFAPERAKGRHRFAYIPFGAGPRICIGQLLAMNEAVLILATLAQRYRLRLAPGARVGAARNITLRPTGLDMIAEKR